MLGGRGGGGGGGNRKEKKNTHARISFVSNAAQTDQGLNRERACNSHIDSIDGEIKSVTKNSNKKLGLLVH